VRALLTASDDRFVVARPGDEIALRFRANGLPPLPDGWTRTFLLYGDGFSKEMDLNSVSPDQVEPLPFHGMTAYPPAGARLLASDAPYDEAARTVPVPLPSIDGWLLLAKPVPSPR
jgi:hypothetical protein